MTSQVNSQTAKADVIILPSDWTCCRHCGEPFGVNVGARFFERMLEFHYCSCKNLPEGLRKRFQD